MNESVNTECKEEVEREVEKNEKEEKIGGRRECEISSEVKLGGRERERDRR